MADENPVSLEWESSDSVEKRIKVTAVGDAKVGKTCMLMTFATNTFPESAVPSLYENSTTKRGRSSSFEVPILYQCKELNYLLALTDTIGTDEYRKLRELFTVGTDVFLVCFCVSDPSTLENARRDWLTEIRILTPKAPFILVGTKTDLRNDDTVLHNLKEQNLKPVSTQEGIKIAKDSGARAYVECSALKGEGIRKIFDTVIDVAMGNADDKGKGGKTKHSLLSWINKKK